MKHLPKNDGARYKKEKSEEAGYSITKTPKEALESLAKLEEDMVEREMDKIIIDGKGTEKRVPTLAETIISKTPHRFGLTIFSEYIRTIKEASEERRRESLWQEEVDIKIETPYKWFGVQGFGDSHIGHYGVDYDELANILAGWLKNDNLRTVLLGDLGSFFVPKGKHPEGMMEDVITPQTQMIALKKFFTEYQDEILANTSDPSHTDWVYKTAGIDVYEYINRELNVPLVNQGGLIRLNFGEVEYSIMPFHNISKFKSSFTLTHAHKRALELHQDADVVMAGHIHKGSFEKAFRGGHEVSLVQIGTLLTMETGSSWAKKQGFLGKPMAYYPIVLFNTQEKRMQIIDYLGDAEDLLKIKK